MRKDNYDNDPNYFAVIAVSVTTTIIMRVILHLLQI